MNLDRIIRESINNIIVENIQFQTLESHLRQLEAYRRQIKSTDLTASGNQQVVNFVGHEFYNYIAALEQALKRCIRSGSINESFISNLLPSELYGIKRDAQKWYYDTYNYLNRKRGYNTNVNQYTNSQEIKSNGNEKLLVILGRWQKISNKFISLNQYYNISRICPAALNAKNEIDKLVQTIQQIQQQAQQQQQNNNAQGTNP